MRALILILLYLARDTLYRWFMRLSSPVSRVLVVFFLSLCGLVFLSSYVIALKVVRQRITENGGNLIVATQFVSQTAAYPGRGYEMIPQDQFGDECYLFHDAFASVDADGTRLSMVEYPLGFAKELAGDSAIRVMPPTPVHNETPTSITVEGHKLEASTLPEEKAGVLRRIYPGGAVFLPQGAMPEMWSRGYIRHYLIRLREVTEENVFRWENALKLLSRLEQSNMNVISGGRLLQNLHQLEASQQQFRFGVSLGISLIICFLLTSISTLEYRQNEYVYALMGSFGISRWLLLGSFVVENTFLVAAGFAAALGALQGVLPYITEELYRSPSTVLTLDELGADIRIFALAFIVCIAVSSIPIFAAVCKPIGKVLK